MGLDAFKSDSSSDDGDSEDEQDTFDSYESSSSAESGSHDTHDADHCVEKFGSTRSELIGDTEWVSEKIRSGWGVLDFKKEIDIYPAVTIDMIKRAVARGDLEYDDIPDYDGNRYNEKPLSWYVRMAVQNTQFTRVPHDLTWKSGTPTDAPEDLTQYYPDEFSQVYMDLKNDGQEDDDNQQTEQSGPSGLDQFIN